MNAKIKNIYYYLPKRLVTNKDLITENPMWDLSSVAKNTGVEQRYFAEEGETALDFSVGARKKFFKESGVNPRQVDCVLYCSHNKDYVVFGNAASSSISLVFSGPIRGTLAPKENLFLKSCFGVRLSYVSALIQF